MTVQTDVLFDHPSLRITASHITTQNISIPLKSITKIEVDRTASTGCSAVLITLLILLGVGLPLTAVIWPVGLLIMVVSAIFFIRALGQSFSSGIDIIVLVGPEERHVIYRGQPSDLSRQITDVLRANTGAVFENHVR